MEDKVRRESQQLLQRLLKEKDPNGIGAIKATDIDGIIKDLVPVFDHTMLAKFKKEMKKDVKAMVRNSVSNKLEVKIEQDMLDYASATTIAVHFLLDHEKKSNRGMSFSGRGLIRLDDIPDFSSTAGSVHPDKGKEKAKKM